METLFKGPLCFASEVMHMTSAHEKWDMKVRISLIPFNIKP